MKNWTMSKKTNHKANARLAALYAKLPKVNCIGRCFVACGPVPMARLEADNMRKADSQRRLPMIRQDVSCIYLTANKRCGVYDARPLVCRVWGTTKGMSCMHGCVPDRWLSAVEFVEIGKQIEQLGGGLVVSGPHGLEDVGTTFMDLNNMRPTDEVARLEEMTKTARALHGGRIVGISPAAENSFVDVNEIVTKYHEKHKPPVVAATGAMKPPEVQRLLGEIKTMKTKHFVATRYKP